MVIETFLLMVFLTMYGQKAIAFHPTGTYWATAGTDRKVFDKILGKRGGRVRSEVMFSYL
jgi:hypothetical protein